MFADARFGYLERIRYGLGYATMPVYWMADIPTRVSFLIDDVFVSRTDLLEENDSLRANLLIAQRELQLLAGEPLVHDAQELSPDVVRAGRQRD